MKTEKLAQPALDPVTSNGPPDFAADSQPKPGGAVWPFHYDDQKVGGMPLVSPLTDAIIFLAAVQPAGRRKGISADLDGVGCHFAYLVGMETTSCLRPLARRRLSTVCPFLVCIRLRKPWVRFLRILLG